MNGSLTRFLGDTPMRVVLKLAVFSVIAGVVMSALGWSPRIIYDGIIRFFQSLWNLGFDAIYNSFEYLFLGAAIVVPLFLIIRLLSYRSTRS